MRQKVGGQSFRPTKGYVAHDGITRGLGLLFTAWSRSDGMGTVETDEATGAGVITTDAGYRGRACE